MAEAIVHLPDAMHEVTISVKLTGRRQLRARLWIGGLLLQLAALVIGCNVEIEDKTNA
jgi:hypothetical protein